MNNGVSIQLEGSSNRLRLSNVKRFARKLGNPKSVALDSHHLAPEFIIPGSSDNGGE